MESEKPGILSILAGETVDPEKRRVSISAPRAVAVARADAVLLTRSLSGSFSPASSVPIRAPLTVDEDDDDDDDDDDDISSSVTDEHNSAIIEASSYSNAHELNSGTDEDESALADVIRGGIRVHRLLGEEQGGETGDVSDFSGGSVIHRPGDVEEETSVHYSSFEEESENSDEFQELSESEISEADRVSMKAKVVIPRASLSLDDGECDKSLGSDDEDAALLRVIKASGDEDTEVEDRALQFGDKGVVDEPECSNSFIGELVSTEEEAVRMNTSDKLDNGLMSSWNMEELSFSVPPGGRNDYMGENEGNSTEASMELGQSFKQLIETGGDAQRTISQEIGGGSIHELNALMKPSDAEIVEDNGVVLAKMGMADKPERSGSNTGELVAAEEYMVQPKSFDNELVSIETSLGVVPGDCTEFLVESENNVIDEDIILDETISHLVKQDECQGSMSKETNNRTYVSNSCEAAKVMIVDDGCVESGSKESGYGDAENMIVKAEESFKSDCDSFSELKNDECVCGPKIGMSFESFQLTPTLDSVTMMNLEVAGGINVDQKDEQEAENEGKQESEDIDRMASFPDENRASSKRSSLEVDNENVENGKQIAEQINEQVNFQSSSVLNQVEMGIKETNFLSLQDVERSLPETSSVSACNITENKTQGVQLSHNHTLMEIDEYEGPGDTRKKLFESAFKNYSEILSSDSSVQLISKKVKERIEKTQLLKEKIQRIIPRTSLSSENSTITEVESNLSVAGEEHQTTLGLDNLPDRTKIMLPEQEFPDDINFSINILVIGKSGVGKSATINSIFGETKSIVGAFGVTTKSANYVVGNVRGIQIRILDTPGLNSSATEERFNQKVLMLIKKSMRKFPVDVILYIDRLDEYPDIHLLQSITSSLGSSIWRNTIVVLTHAASDVSDSSSYKAFIAQRSSLMYQFIRQAVPELSCVDQSKMPGIVLAENNMSSFWGNKTSEFSNPDWRLNLLIFCCLVKIRSKNGSLQKENTVTEKASFDSQLPSLTLFCALWNVLLLGDNSRQTSHSHVDLEEKKRQLLDSYPKILWDEQSQECLEQEEIKDEERHSGKGQTTNRGLEEGSGFGRVRTRRRRIGFQATKRFGIYLDTYNLHTGFSIGSRSCKEDEQEEVILVRKKSSMSVLGLAPILMSLYTSVYGRKHI